MATDSELRRELEALGDRRAKLDKEDAKLAKDVTRVLKRAYGRLSVAECARLLQMHRTTVYRVYHPHD